MSQIKEELVRGIVRNKSASYTVKMTNGENRVVDRSTGDSLLKRLDRDRSRMEREGTRK